MTPYEIYTFILCLIVFVTLTVLFSVLIGYITRLSVRLIRAGAEDERIRHEQTHPKRSSGFFSLLSVAFSGVVFAVLLTVFVFSVYAKVCENAQCVWNRSFKVVLSDSMSERYEKNDYLFENDLQDQLQTFDLILTSSLPKEEELELYDIVVYESKGSLLVHRIIGIEPPNEAHPDEYHFLLKGDANQYNDRFPVRYSQMRAIYTGVRIPFIGTFITFMQSPAGWLCILLMAFALIATPLLEKKLAKERQLRWEELQKEAPCRLPPQPVPTLAIDRLRVRNGKFYLLQAIFGRKCAPDRRVRMFLAAGKIHFESDRGHKGGGRT